MISSTDSSDSERDVAGRDETRKIISAAMRKIGGKRAETSAAVQQMW
jgi:hypothetical protein